MSTGSRFGALAEVLASQGVSSFVTTDPDTQTYLTGFRALLYSRPIVLFVTDRHATLVVPMLELDHAAEFADVDEVLAYREHPLGSEPVSPEELLAQVLRERRINGTLGYQAARCPVALFDALRAAGLEPVDVGPGLEALRAIKDADELATIRDAAHLVEIGVGASLDACAPGTTELDIDAIGATAIHREASALHEGATLESFVMTPSGPQRSILPHVFSTTRTLQAGDSLIHTRQVALNGYRAELERTVVLSAPSTAQRQAFDAMLSAQQAAMAAVRAGVRMADVDRAARARFEQAGLDRWAIHRTGHGIGVAPHEPPYVRFDADQPLEENMVITIEPGIYVPGLGGFRHSDTLRVTADGAELLTHHPSDLSSMTRG